MKNVLKCVFFAVLFFPICPVNGAVSIRPGDIFVVKDGCYVPLFTVPDTSLRYEYGKRGNECYELDTVLLPKSIIKILEIPNHKTVRAEYFTKILHGQGYIHVAFFEKCMTAKTDDFDNNNLPEPTPMPISSIKRILQKCLEGRIPYCYGANNLERIDLSGIYEFTPFDKEVVTAPPYELKGFDCSGVLHYISGGMLPHCTNGLHNAGKILFKFDKNDTYIREVKEEVLDKLRDTDYLVFLVDKNDLSLDRWGHVLISYKGGLLEFRSALVGCTYTTCDNVMSRLNSFIESAKRVGSDVFVVRWHPELLQKKD